MANSRYSVAITQLFNNTLHSPAIYNRSKNTNKNGNNQTNMNSTPVGHFLALHTPYDDEYAIDFITDMMDSEQCDPCLVQEIIASRVPSHDITLHTPNFDIVELVTTPSGHTTAIKKTFWLSYFQRLWRSHKMDAQKRKRCDGIEMAGLLRKNKTIRVE